jgi:hypothetical protein
LLRHVGRIMIRLAMLQGRPGLRTTLCPRPDGAAAALLPILGRQPHAGEMFAVDDAAAEAIRIAFERGGELSAVAELRRHFPLITDNAQARVCVRAIASWNPLPMKLPKGPRLPRRDG